MGFEELKNGVLKKRIVSPLLFLFTNNFFNFQIREVVNKFIYRDIDIHQMLIPVKDDLLFLNKVPFEFYHIQE